MASKYNSNFNYKYQVNGETLWERIKVLNGFLEGRIQALKLKECSILRHKSKLLELEYMLSQNSPEYLILRFKAELIEYESGLEIQKHAFELCEIELEDLKNILKELYEQAEATRIPGYTDDQMYEINAENEFTTMICREIQSEIIANGRPSAARIKNAMSCPATFNTLKLLNIIPEETQVLDVNKFLLETKEQNSIAYMQ